MRVLIGIILIYLLGLSIMLIDTSHAAAPVRTVSQVVPAVAGVKVPARLLGFREWKISQIQASALRIQQLRKSMMELRVTHPRSEKLHGMQNDISQEQWNYEMAQDFTAQDYLILYVKPHPSADKYKMAATQMSQEEMGQVIEAYFNNLQKPAPLPTYQRARLGVQSPQ